MNVFIGSGKIANLKIFTNEKNEILKFRLKTESDGKKTVEYVPCVVFNPSDSVKNLMKEGKNLELQGIVRTSSFKVKNKTNYSTEVVVNKYTLHSS
jgi:hypothetical protein